VPNSGACLVDAGLQHEHIIEAQVHMSTAQEEAAHFQRLHLAPAVKADVVLYHRLAAAWPEHSTEPLTYAILLAKALQSACECYYCTVCSMGTLYHPESQWRKT
jgi:hypothetical protein